MGYIRLDEQPEVYHYTHRKNLDNILREEAESGVWAIGSAGLRLFWRIP